MLMGFSLEKYETIVNIPMNVGYYSFHHNSDHDDDAGDDTKNPEDKNNSSSDNSNHHSALTTACSSVELELYMTSLQPPTSPFFCTREV